MPRGGAGPGGIDPFRFDSAPDGREPVCIPFALGDLDGIQTVEQPVGVSVDGRDAIAAPESRGRPPRAGDDSDDRQRSVLLAAVEAAVIPLEHGKGRQGEQPGRDEE